MLCYAKHESRLMKPKKINSRKNDKFKPELLHLGSFTV